MPAVTLVQHSHHPGTVGNLIDAYEARLCHAVLSGNIVIVGIKNGAGASPTSITDDKGNTYTLGVSRDDGSDRIHIYYSLNVTNGPRIITASYSPAKNWVQMVVSEFAGIKATAVSDGTANNGGTGTALTSAAIVTTVAGDLIYNFCEQDTTSSDITSWTKGTGFTLLSADIADSVAAQFQVQSSAGSINAAMTMAPSNSWMSVAMAFKADAAVGTLPTVGQMRILRCHHLSTKNASVSPKIFFVPCDSGNLLVFTWIFGSRPITGITDNQANTWAEKIHFQGPGASGNIDVWRVLNGTMSNAMQVTITWTGGASATVDSTIWFEFTNAHSIQDGVTATAQGEELEAGSWNSGNLTPGVEKGIVLSILGAENSGADYVSASSPGDFISTTTPPENISPWPVDSNNGWMVQYHTTTALIQNNWTDASGAPQAWGEVIVSFIESPGVPILDQEGYRFFNDDGTESGMTAKAAQDVNISLDKDVNVVLRKLIDHTDGGSEGLDLQLEAAVDGTSNWFKINPNNG